MDLYDKLYQQRNSLFGWFILCLHCIKNLKQHSTDINLRMKNRIRMIRILKH